MENNKSLKVITKEEDFIPVITGEDTKPTKEEIIKRLIKDFDLIKGTLPGLGEGCISIFYERPDLGSSVFHVTYEEYRILSEGLEELPIFVKETNDCFLLKKWKNEKYGYSGIDLWRVSYLAI